MKRRLRWAQLVFVLMVGLVLFRSARVQLAPDERLVRNQKLLYQTEMLRLADRGSIFDRKGNPLAVSVKSYSLFSHPHKVKQRVQVASTLSPMLGISLARLKRLLSSKKSFVWIKRKLPVAMKDRIEALNFKGLYFLNEPDRVYPNGPLGAHFLGFTNIDLKGMDGVELKYDKALEGIPRSVEVLKDAKGRIIYVGESASSRSRAGYNLTLTIDQKIQFALEEELKVVLETFKAKSAMALAMDPRNGEILALGSLPSFDPNNPGKEAVQYARNRLISDMYEPGSTLKMVTVGAALMARVAHEATVFDCENGRLRVGRHLITDAELSHAHETLSLGDILKYSSNVCAVKVAQKVGKTRLHNLLLRLGFGSATGIDLPGEIRGSVPPLKSWKDITLATIAYGHGIATTPIQLAVAYSAVANGGYLVKPHVLLRVEDEFGHLIYENVELPRKKVFEPDLAKRLRSMLVRVTEREGTAPRAAPFGIPIPGKTGTSIKFDESAGGYKEGAYLSSFVGMFPAQSPRVVLLVLVDEPQDRFYGGSVAGPAFKNVSEKVMRVLSLYPEPKLMEASVGVKKRDKKQEKRQRRKRSRRRLSRDAIPSLVGLSLFEVREKAQLHQFDFVYEGVGRVVSQYPPAGIEMSKGVVVKVELQL